jgi:release factor glutamine methyltransferase
MTSVHQHIAEAREALVRAGLPAADAAFDAEVLARHALGWDRARLVSAGRDPAPSDFAARYQALISRRLGREPVAYITGHREFWGLDFEVTPAILIPRPETELIVEAVCERYPDRVGVRSIVDVGTGSGCLAVALANEFTTADVIAADVSPEALDVARRNAERLGQRNVSFITSDLLDGIDGRVDVIVSNPPYVPQGAALAPEILRFEPSLALFAGVDGLSLLTRLIADAPARLAPGGLFVVEFGLGQDASINALAAAAGWRTVVMKSDLQNIPRIAVMSM